MPLLGRRMKRYFSVVAFIVFISISAFILTSYGTVMISFSLGVVACILSFTTIYVKALVIGKLSMRTSPGVISYLTTVLGIVTRYGLIAVLVVVALIFPENFHLIAILAGYAGLYIYIMMDMFVQLQKKRGE